MQLYVQLYKSGIPAITKILILASRWKVVDLNEITDNTVLRISMWQGSVLLFNFLECVYSYFTDVITLKVCTYKSAMHVSLISDCTQILQYLFLTFVKESSFRLTGHLQWQFHSTQSGVWPFLRVWILPDHYQRNYRVRFEHV